MDKVEIYHSETIQSVLDSITPEDEIYTLTSMLKEECSAHDKLLRDGKLTIPASYAKLITSGEMTRMQEAKRVVVSITEIIIK